MASPDCDGGICIVRGAPDGPTTLNCGSTDDTGNFCIEVPPLQAGWIIYVEDRCPPETERGQPELIGSTPAPTLGTVGLAIGIALLGLIGMIGLRRLRWWPQA